MSVSGLYVGYTVKYNPPPSGVPLGFALGNSFRRSGIFDLYPSSRPNTDTVSTKMYLWHKRKNLKDILYQNKANVLGMAASNRKLSNTFQTEFVLQCARKT